MNGNNGIYCVNTESWSVHVAAASADDAARIVRSSLGDAIVGVDAVPGHAPVAVKVTGTLGMAWLVVHQLRAIVAAGRADRMRLEVADGDAAQVRSMTVALALHPPHATITAAASAWLRLRGYGVIGTRRRDAPIADNIADDMIADDMITAAVRPDEPPAAPEPAPAPAPKPRRRR